MLAVCTLVAAFVFGAPVLGAQEAQPAPDAAAPSRAFDQQLGTHPYFSRVALERVESRAPYLFLVQRSGDPHAERATVLAERYAQRLDPALQLFQREIAEPLGLVRRADQRLVIAVLATPGDVDNYLRVTRVGGHYEGQGFYDSMLNAAVLFEDPFHVMRALGAQQLAARHALMHVCAQAWFAPGQEAPSTSWVLEALACELSRRDPDASDEPVAPDEDLRAFLLALQDEQQRWAAGRTLGELCTLATPESLADYFAEHPDPSGAAAPAAASAEAAFYRQSVLLLHYLLEGDERRYRAGALAYLKQVFAGSAGRESFAQSFEGTSAAQLEAAFAAWALRAGKASDPRSGIDAAVVERALLRGVQPAAAAPAAKPAADAAPTPATAAPAPTRPPPAAVAPAPLPVLVPGLATDLAHGSEDERFAFALYELGRGRTQSGLEAIDALMRTTSDENLRARLEREQRRVAAWVELRDAFLRERVESQEVIEFTYKGNKLKTQVLGYADGQLHLEKARAPEFLGPDAIDPLDLAQQIKPSGAPNDWVRLYPYVLQDDPRGRKLLKDDGAEAGTFLADVRSDYPPRLRLALLAGRLQEFATKKPPASAAEARKQFEAVAAWRRDAEGSPLLAEKHDALRAHARTLLLRELEGRPAKEFLRGKLTAREGDTVRLAYEFDDPRELEDFSPDLYPPRAIKALAPENSADVPYHVAQGELVAQGQASLRSLVDFTAPLSVRYTLEYIEIPLPTASGCAALGICDDGQEHFLWAVNLVNLQRLDARGNDYAPGKEEGIFYGRTYLMELRHDGTTLRLLCDGRETQTLPVGPRQSGAVFLCASSDCPIHVQRLEIEGHLPPSGLDRLKGARVERELAEF